MALKLNTVLVSTRPGRIGDRIAAWFDGFAKAHGAFENSLVDLADFKLPIFDEPHHPRMGNYQHAHTKALSAAMDSADAFVFVTPEYNFYAPPSLVNAIGYLWKEWNYKAAGIVSYGGLSGGLRAAQSERLLLSTMRMMPIPEGVAIPFASKLIDANGSFTPSESTESSAKTMLDELARWAGALKPLRG